MDGAAACLMHVVLHLCVYRTRTLLAGVHTWRTQPAVCTFALRQVEKKAAFRELVRFLNKTFRLLACNSLLHGNSVNMLSHQEKAFVPYLGDHISVVTCSSELDPSPSSHSFPSPFV